LAPLRSGPSEFVGLSVVDVRDLVAIPAPALTRPDARGALSRDR
jgi:hypothetical protein